MSAYSEQMHKLLRGAGDSRRENKPANSPDVAFVRGVFLGAQSEQSPAPAAPTTAPKTATKTEATPNAPAPVQKKDPLEALRAINEARMARGQIPAGANTGPQRGNGHFGPTGMYPHPGFGHPGGHFPMPLAQGAPAGGGQYIEWDEDDQV